MSLNREYFIGKIACGVWSLFGVIIFSLAFACKPALYKVVNDQDYVLNKNIPKKYILLKEKYFYEGANVKMVVERLNDKSYETVKSTLILEPKTTIFLQAIDLMMKKLYKEAFYTINTLNDEDFDCQVGLLKADCFRELKYEHDYVERYQSALDCAKDDKVIEITKNRFRFYKYAF